VRAVDPQRAFGQRWSALLGPCAVLLLGAAAAASAAAPVAQPGDLLPDLVQEAPQDIGISHVRGHVLLGFMSAVHNAGDGPLIIRAGRPNARVRDMTAAQVVTRTDGSTRRIGGVGFLRYVRSPDHSHWHFLPFERYELRREGSRVGLVRDRKSGFCLGDRYRVEPRPVRAVGAPAYVGRCGLANPARLSLTEGISVGWGDDYAAYLDGQHIDVTTVPAGRYVLVHSVNVSGRILERDRTNNVASRRIELRRARGRTTVRVLPALPA
jgi:lysyl oxidase